MTETTVIRTEIRFDGKRTESLFDGRPAIVLEGLSRVAEGTEAWSSPHLFVASVEGCLFLTMWAIAEKMRIGIANYTSTAEGILASTDGKHKEIAEVVIRPKITLTNEADRARLPQLFKLAEEHCYVARSVTSKIRVEF